MRTVRQKLRPNGQKLSKSELALMLGVSRNYLAMVEGRQKKEFLAAPAALEEALCALRWQARN